MGRRRPARMFFRLVALGGVDEVYGKNIIETNRSLLTFQGEGCNSDRSKKLKLSLTISLCRKIDNNHSFFILLNYLRSLVYLPHLEKG